MVRPPYPVAVRLCTIAAERWAELCAAYYQVNLLRLRAHMYANLVYAWCIERVEHAKLEQWLLDLADLLPWQDSTSDAAAQAESDSFMTMMNRQ